MLFTLHERQSYLNPKDDDEYHTLCIKMMESAVKEFDNIELLGYTPSTTGSESLYFTLGMIGLDDVHHYKILRMSTHRAITKHRIAIDLYTTRYAGMDEMYNIILDRIEQQSKWYKLTKVEYQILELLNDSQDPMTFPYAQRMAFYVLRKYGLLVRANEVNTIAKPLVNFKFQPGLTAWDKLRDLINNLVNGNLPENWSEIRPFQYETNGLILTGNSEYWTIQFGEHEETVNIAMEDTNLHPRAFVRLVDRVLEFAQITPK